MRRSRRFFLRGGAKVPNAQYSYKTLGRRSDGQAGKNGVIPGRSDLMLPATELERELDVKSEVSRGHSRDNSKD